MDYRCHQAPDSHHVINLKVENEGELMLIDCVIVVQHCFMCVRLTDGSKIYRFRMKSIKTRP